MVTAAVGFHCPECVKSGKQKVYNSRAAFGGGKSLWLTPGLIAANVAVFVLSLGSGSTATEAGGSFLERFGLYGPAVRYNHEYYRIITAGFMHSGFLHIGFNMYALWIMGNMLEPALGRLRFGLIYFVGLLAGSVGALVLEPNALAVGASGAIFALFGAAFIAQRAAGINPWQSGIGITIAINLVITFGIPHISKGGHLGGLAGGLLVGYLLLEGPKRMRNRDQPVIIAAALIPVMFIAAIICASAFSG
jgi:membrane associated rhomboid family serine protease